MEQLLYFFGGWKSIKFEEDTKIAFAQFGYEAFINLFITTIHKILPSVCTEGAH